MSLSCGNGAESFSFSFKDMDFACGSSGELEDSGDDGIRELDFFGGTGMREPEDFGGSGMREPVEDCGGGGFRDPETVN